MLTFAIAVVTGVVLVPFFAAAMVQGFMAMLQENQERKLKLAVYRENGGQSYVNPNVALSGRPWENKSALFPNPKEWQEQDEINRRARKIAGLPE